MPVYGIDISSWQTGINPAASQVPLGFAIFKSSEGNFSDPRYQQFYRQSVGKIPELGAYHYFKTGVDVATQVKTALNATSGTNPNFYAVDFEQQGNVLNAAAAKSALTMIDVLHAMTGKPVYLYTNQSLYQQYFSASRVPLWLSAPSGVSIHANPTFIQTAFNAPGAQFGVSGGGADVNIFPGTLGQLKTVLGETQTAQNGNSIGGAQGSANLGGSQIQGAQTVPVLQNTQGSAGGLQGQALPGININLLPQSVTSFLSNPDFGLTIVFLVLGFILIIAGFALFVAPAAIQAGGVALKTGAKVAAVAA